MAERICEAIANGQSLRAICREDDMPQKRTVLQWLDKNEDFRTQYARARVEQADHFAEEILEIADDGKNDFLERENADGSKYSVADHEHINRSRLRVDARKWLMSKMLPKKYGDRVMQEVTGALNVTIMRFGDQAQAPKDEDA